jgi:transposase InsO family protein
VTEVLYELVKNKGGSIGCVNACEAIGVSRSGYAAWASREAPEVDAGLLKAIHEAAKNPRYGYRRVFVEIRGKGFMISPKRVLEIMRSEDLTCKKKAFKPRTTNSDHGFRKYSNLVKDLAVTGLNQVWVGDITYVWVGGKFAYLATILDRFSRKCLGWALSRTLEATIALRALRQAFACRNGQSLSELIHHTDQGVQYACDEYTAILTRRGIRISMTEDGDPRENAFAESFNKTVKYEEAYLTEYASFEEAEVEIAKYIQWYNKKRLHSSIGYQPPDEFEEECLRKRAS